VLNRHLFCGLRLGLWGFKAAIKPVKNREKALGTLTSDQKREKNVNVKEKVSTQKPLKDSTR
jgi:hypothetical protein